MLKTILTPKLYLPIVYIVGAIVVYKIIIHLLNKTLFKRKGKKKTTFQMNKEATIINLIKSIIKYLIAIIVVLAILNLYGVQTGAIIASLGIVGAVLGLAFQDTIKNLLSGITIIFDDHYVQGDIITINGFRGEVIELGLQTTKVKGYNGEVLIIQNSAITSVINHSMYDTMYYLSFSVSNNVSLKQLETILNNINKKLIKMNEVKNQWKNFVEIIIYIKF